MSKTVAGLRSLISLARLANYEVKWIPGHNGHCYYWANKIELGIHLVNTEKLIVLAHELGHIFDYTETPPDLSEAITIFKFNTIYQVSDIYYDREVRAWGYAKYLLEQVGSWEEVQVRFEQCKESALSSYKRRKESAEKNGTNVPDPVAFAEAKESIERRHSVIKNS